MTFGFDLTEASYSISNQMLSFQMWIMERVSIVTSKTNFKTSSLEELGCKYSVLLRSSGLWRWCVVFIINQCRLRRWLSSESCLSCFGRIFSFLSGSCIPIYLSAFPFLLHTPDISYSLLYAASNTSHHMLSLKAFIIYPKPDTSQADYWQTESLGHFMYSDLLVGK